MKRVLYLLATIAIAGCAEPVAPPPVYESAPVTKRDIIVAVEAAGIIEPSRTVEVKSKASGEILSLAAETGDFVEAGTLLVQIDKRTPRNNLNQAQAELEAALARRTIAETQASRSERLFKSRTINEVDYEQTVLEFANAKAEVVRSQVAVENARIALDDTDVRAPITGTVTQKLVETGQVISSPTMDVGGGTILLQMADLATVQVKALVDETDIGKIAAGQPARVTVTAYPNQPFVGEVMKIEPEAMAEQTVTTFSVMIILGNESGLLRPGMNADVEIRVAEALDVVAVPTIALKVDAEISIASDLIGLSGDSVREELIQARDNDKSPTADSGSGYRFSNRYWVFREAAGSFEPVNVTTGITDLEYSEVLSGLAEGDKVLMLPSSGLIRSQRRFQDRMRQFTGLPGMSSNSDKGD